MSKSQKTVSSAIPVHEGQTVLDFSSDAGPQNRVAMGSGSELVANGILYGNSFMNEQLQERLKAYSESTIGRSSDGQIDASTPVSDERLTQAYLDMQTLRINDAIDDGIDYDDPRNTDKMDEWTELRDLQADQLAKDQQNALDARFAEQFPDLPGLSGLSNQQKVQMLWSARLNRKLTEEEQEKLMAVADAQGLQAEDTQFLFDEIDSGGVAYVFEDYKVGNTADDGILSGGQTSEGELLDDTEAQQILSQDEVS